MAQSFVADAFIHFRSLRIPFPIVLHIMIGTDCSEQIPESGSRWTTERIGRTLILAPTAMSPQMPTLQMKKERTETCQ